MKEKIFKVENLEFRFGPQLKDVRDDELICDSRNCPYNLICDKVPDPRALDDPEYSFEDFCSEIGENDDPENLYRMPLPGSLEEGFKDYPEILKVLEENKKVD